MVRKSMLYEKPPMSVAMVGGATGALLAAALLHLGWAAGVAAPDLPRLAGGVFTGDGTTAYWLGVALLFVIGWLVLPPILSLVWGALPGAPLTLGGTFLKGLLFGLLLWALTGLLLPLLEAASALPSPPRAGWFGLDGGLAAAAALLAVPLAYALATALVGGFTRGISPIQALGWEGHGAGHAA